jgi:hypothetical protein
MYDIIIIGGGPAGVALTTILSKTDKNILLIEREHSLGGCWRIEWKDNLYYTEHSPKVMTEDYVYFNSLFRFFGNSENPPLKETYPKDIIRYIYFGKNVYHKFTILDIFKIIKEFLKSRFIENKQTVSEFINNQQLSKGGKEAFYIISVTLATVPEKMMIQDIFNEISEFNSVIHEMTKPEEWIISANNYFKTCKNVKVITSYEVKKINIKINKNESNYPMYVINDKIIGKECILSLPPIALYDIIYNSEPLIQNNWMPIHKLKKWVWNSYYSSIAFQLHFDKVVEFKEEWCWSCVNDWNIIILPMSNYLEEFSKDPSIKTVWSCTIIDQNNYSKYLKKHVYECSLEEIKEECLRQLNIPKPKVFTFYDGLHIRDGKYMSKDTGFIRQKYGVIERTGSLPNLHIVSAVNMKGTIYMDKAIKSAYIFCKKRYKRETDIVFSQLLKSKSKKMLIKSVSGISFLIIILMVIHYIRKKHIKK